ncbi:MAG: hypothetical protein FJ265_00825 [Planctomycetes bacterium]|nr:hypothetical protein [Planctomycetota bacterium]
MKRLAIAVLGASLGAQVPTYPHLVLTQLPGSPAAQLVAVDAATGVPTALGRFPSDTLPPRAVAIDPYDGAPIVALDLGPALSRIVRLESAGAGFAEFLVADLPGPVKSLCVQQDDLLAAVDAPGLGLYRVPRRGGVPALAVAQPNLTALHGFGPGDSYALLAWTGRPGSAAPDSGTVLVDVATGTAHLGPNTFPNPGGLLLTGAIDLPTGVPRQLLSFADGTFVTFAGMIGPPVPVTPSQPIPAGGATAMHPLGAYGFTPVVLGGVSFPFLYTLEAWSGSVTLLSAALPGDPVDFATGLERAAVGLRHAPACGAPALRQGWSGLQQPGSTFVITVQGPANDHAVLVVGLTDFAAGMLPYPLPGGCALSVFPGATVLRLLGATGFASQAVAVPPGPGFLGTVLHCQWTHFGAAGVSVSDAVAHRIGL